VETTNFQNLFLAWKRKKKNGEHKEQSCHPEDHVGTRCVKWFFWPWIGFFQFSIKMVTLKTPMST
jgi:hypothetical protein